MTTDAARKVGDLQVWWIPQVGMKAVFTVPVATVAEGVKLLEVLAFYDLFQLEHRIKPDYTNCGGLQRWSADDGDGWEDWYDEATGEDDPAEYLAALHSSPVGTEDEAEKDYRAGWTDGYSAAQEAVGAEPPSSLTLERGDVLVHLIDASSVGRMSLRWPVVAIERDGRTIWRHGAPAQAEPAAPLVSGDAARLENIAGALDKHHERWRWVDAITDLRAIADDMRHPATPSARPTPAAVPEQRNPAQDMRDAGILLAPKRAIPTED